MTVSASPASHFKLDTMIFFGCFFIRCRLMPEHKVEPAQKCTGKRYHSDYEDHGTVRSSAYRRGVLAAGRLPRALAAVRKHGGAARSLTFLCQLDAIRSDDLMSLSDFAQFFYALRASLNFYSLDLGDQ